MNRLLLLLLFACAQESLVEIADPDEEEVDENTPLTYDDDSVATPDLGELNPWIVKTLREYPTDGSYGYYWPRGDESWLGTANDIYYKGELYARGDGERRSFCSGITFEVFMRAYQAWADDNGVPFEISSIPDHEALDLFRRRWWGKERLDTTNHALTSFGLGKRIPALLDIKPGDFVQLWRRDNTGHSVIFLGWTKKNGHISGIRYWSTQEATDGIGERTEKFGKSGHLLHVGRLRATRPGYWKQ